ncbi:MAG: ATP-binding cassette domain-containing protein [Methanophagales archaeon]|nr:ATP-binding cassette domain-containing protein [Methanophagales archaeon]
MQRREIVKLEDVWLYFDNMPVLEGINLSIKDRDFLGIIGPNGGGKTCLLKLILGLLKPSRGELTVFGHTAERSRKSVGYVPQYSLFDRDFPINVLDVVLMGRVGQMKRFRRYSEEDKKLASEALQTVEMHDYRNSQIGQLSGGQQQRVFIARALVTEPKMLLLDEPMASVDSHMQTELYELFEKLRQQMAIVLVSHDISAVSIYVDKIACLNRKLFYHDSKELTAEDLEESYLCPVEIIAHGVPHRVLKEHR